MFVEIKNKSLNHKESQLCSLLDSILSKAKGIGELFQ